MNDRQTHVRLALNNVERIDAEVAKLRLAVANGTYDPRSIVGDAILVMEAQLRQAKEHLLQVAAPS